MQDGPRQDVAGTQKREVGDAGEGAGTAPVIDERLAKTVLTDADPHQALVHYHLYIPAADTLGWASW